MGYTVQYLQQPLSNRNYRSASRLKLMENVLHWLNITSWRTLCLFGMGKSTNCGFTSTQPCIPTGSLDRVSGVQAGKSPLVTWFPISVRWFTLNCSAISALGCLHGDGLAQANWGDHELPPKGTWSVTLTIWRLFHWWKISLKTFLILHVKRPCMALKVYVQSRKAYTVWREK